MKRRSFLRTVARMRAGQPGDWATDSTGYDMALIKRLMSRVGYGGRKGWRAFQRLWRMRVRPFATRITIRIKGFEVNDRGLFGSESPEFRKLDYPVYCESGVTPGRRQGCECVPKHEPCVDCVRFEREMTAGGLRDKP